MPTWEFHLNICSKPEVKFSGFYTAPTQREAVAIAESNGTACVNSGRQVSQYPNREDFKRAQCRKCKQNPYTCECFIHNNLMTEPKLPLNMPDPKLQKDQ